MYVCVCVLDTFINSEDDHDDFQDGPERKDCYQKLRKVIRMVTIPRLVTIPSKKLLRYFELIDEINDVKF